VPSRLISVRLDAEADAALKKLAATGMTASEAIRSALILAAERLHDPSLAAEAARLAADPADRSEKQALLDEMEALRAPW
jgi:Arc/MetJ-type ribon-helix-helix transcriptional regulator